MRRLRPRVLILALAAVLALTGGCVVVSSAQRSDAADLSKFRAGNIISDSVFFNSGTMDEGAIQSFLDGKVTSCVSGYTCLRSYGQATVNKPADAMCSGYSGASWESSARIIAKVAQSCGINPQVLLVTLQKEQSLVTHRDPSAWRYTIAMGQGCPDTADCDTAFYGFQNQVYGAARQFKRYANPPGTSQYFTWYAPGKTWNVLYNPDASCGSGPVFIENQATANLYYYTPYQPNRSSLAAGYGQSSDSCASYGNRNFFNYFTDWFGSPSYAVSGSIRDYWLANGAATGPAGDVRSEMATYPDGWGQQFERQDLFIRRESRVVPVQGNIRALYRASGGPIGPLRWPMSEEVAVSGGWWQQFEQGRIYARADGSTSIVRGSIGALYVDRGAQAGPLGWPREDTRSIASGLAQKFENGVAYSAATSAVLPNTLADDYERLGGPGSSMGWPTTELISDTSGKHVAFQGAWYQEAATGAVWVKGDIGQYYVKSGGLSSSLGAVVGQEVSHRGGWSQAFANGTLYSSRAGTYNVSAPFVSKLDSLGGPDGAIGFPSDERKTLADGSFQRFTAGYVTSRGTEKPLHVQGAMAIAYRDRGGPEGPLGLPTTTETTVADGWIQTFERGQIVVGPYGTFQISTAAAEAWKRVGGATGRLGWPRGDASQQSGTARQAFAGGYLVGDTNPFPVWGAIADAYLANDAALRAPLGAETSVPGGWVQQFETGSVYAPVGRSAQAVAGAFNSRYAPLGGPTSRLGWPTTGAVSRNGGAVQSYDGGVIAGRQSVFVVTGQILKDWKDLGDSAGRMSFPLSDESFDGRGWHQRFEGGWLFVNQADGRSLRVVGALAQGYEQLGGQAGRLGRPTSNERIEGGKWTQSFEGGTLQLNYDGSFSVG